MGSGRRIGQTAAVFLAMGFVCAAGAIASPIDEAVSAIGEGIPLSIDRCVAVALAANPSFLSEREDLRSTERAVLEAYATFLPQVNANYTGSRYKTAFSRFQVPEDLRASNENQIGISLSQTFFSWPDVKGIHQARNDRSADRAGFEADRQDLIYNVRFSCHDLLKMGDLLEVARENLRVGEEQLKLAEKMREVGAGVAAEVLKAKAEVESNRLDVITARKNLSVAQATLLTFMGLDVNLPIRIERPAEGDRDVPSFDECVETAWSRRPDLLELEYTRRASDDASASAWGEYVPSLTGSYFYGWSQEELNSDILDRKNNTWQARIMLSVPILNVGTLSRIRQRRSEAVAARHSVEAKRQAVAFEIREAILSIEESFEKIEVADRNVTAAEEDLRVSQGKYKHGLVAILDLIEAQVSLAEARAARVEAEYDGLSARASLDRAMGVGR